ncbi:MAG: AmmeMemoRadiSam system protein B [Comamonadaceae bacterium]|nr:AmmeMemoRadiSam system protein B [Comamonadaceae bacterium]
MRALLANGKPPALPAAPKALIVPHAGYVYSGPIAASAYAQLAPVARPHPPRRAARAGAPGAGARAGAARRSRRSTRRSAAVRGRPARPRRAAPACRRSSPARAAHAAGALAGSAAAVPAAACSATSRCVPLAVGDATADEVAEVLDRLWGGDETLIVDQLRPVALPALRRRRGAIDRATVDQRAAPRYRRSTTSRPAAPRRSTACCWPRAATACAPELLDLRNSGDTAGDRGRVVGYAAFGLRAAPTAGARVDRARRAAGEALLPHRARSAIADALRLIGLPRAEHADLAAPSPARPSSRCASTASCAAASARWRPSARCARTCAANARGRRVRRPALRAAGARRVSTKSRDRGVAAVGPTPLAASRERGDLLAQLRAGRRRRGARMAAGRRGTFLPQVWEQLPDTARRSSRI